MSVTELVVLMGGVQLLLSGAFWLINRLIGGSVMAQVNKKLNEIDNKRKDSENKIINIMVKDKEDANEVLYGNIKQLSKEMILGDKNAIKHAVQACDSSQKQAEEKQEAVRKERTAKYEACITNIQDSVKKVENSMGEHNTTIIENLKSIYEQINANARNIAVHDDRFQNMKNKEG